jgi:uncharacterized membrane-anchored protein
VAVVFFGIFLYEFLALNPIYQNHYDTAKRPKEIRIVLATAAVVMIWVTAEYRSNSFTFLACGPLSDDMT